MGTEIERKFRVRGIGWRDEAASRCEIRQGYLSLDPERVVRVRWTPEASTLTVKGRAAGATRAEYEWAIPEADALALLEGLCLRPVIEKTRWCVPFAGRTFEVDEFTGASRGLVVAELELEHEDAAFERPDWLGDEVTEDPRYANASLVRHPYTAWPEQAR